MEHRDLCDVVGSWAERKGGSSGECWVLFVKEKAPDEIIEVHLTNVFSECPKRSGRVFSSWVEVSASMREICI